MKASIRPLASTLFTLSAKTKTLFRAVVLLVICMHLPFTGSLRSATQHAFSRVQFNVAPVIANHNLLPYCMGSELLHCVNPLQVSTCAFACTLANTTNSEGMGPGVPASDIFLGGGWLEAAKILANDGAMDDQFGRSVSINGNYAIVGAYRDSDHGEESGSAYIFHRIGNSWTQQAKLTASDASEMDAFGLSVSISGDYAIVGAYRNSDHGINSGSAYIFHRNGSTWTQQTKLTASDASTQDRFGRSVSISGDYAIVGAYLNDSYLGSAYIFYNNGSDWVQQSKLTASDLTPASNLGFSVSISGDYAIVGAYKYNAYTGAAYIFHRNDSTWTQQAKLTASDGADFEQFGWSVSINGDYATVGAPTDDENGYNSGSAYIFHRSDSIWTQQSKLTASDGAEGDTFGTSISISGDYVVVGSSNDYDNGTNSGSAYMFHRSGNSWVQQPKLKASDAFAYEWFGISVSISDDYLIVGAMADGGFGNSAGSAYLFVNENAVSASETNLGCQIKLYQNVPNPFDEVTLIGFELPEAASVKLRITDVSGREVQLTENRFEAGYHEVEVRNLPARGLYFCQLQTEGFTRTLKMVRE